MQTTGLDVSAAMQANHPCGTTKQTYDRPKMRYVTTDA
jgi:hypothetical protein